MKYFSSFSIFYWKFDINSLEFHLLKKKSKNKAFEFENHFLHRISILKEYFDPVVYIVVSISESGLRFYHAY